MATLLKTTPLSLAMLCAFVAAGASQADDHCATQPPPKGLVARCQSRVFIVPDNPMAFRFVLTEWMRTCVSSDRAPGLVYGAESVDDVWDLIKDLPGHSRVVTIVPKYEPLTFTKAGKTCYGVKSVEFDVRRQRGTVDVDGDIEIIKGPTDDMIKAAAKAAKQALALPSVKGSAELSRFLGVLDGLERYGKDFEDTYFPVAPFQAGSMMDKPACYKEYSGGTYTCLPPDQAVAACTRHLAQDLVQSYHYDKVTPARFAEILEIKANEIQRGLTHMHAIQNSGTGLGTCPGLKDAIMPKVGNTAARGKTTLYGYY
jgi:hypothetical protein